MTKPRVTFYKQMVLIGFLLFLPTSVLHAKQITLADKPVFTKESASILTTQGAVKLSVEVAKSIKEQQFGLMFRKHLPNDEGMLFLFENARPVLMWMKNTFIPLDMLFIDSQGKIVYIAENTVPESLERIGSEIPVGGVLELAGGAVKKYGIRLGDRVEHPFFEAYAKH